MEFCSPQYGQTTDPTVSAVPSPRGNSSSRSSKKSIIEQGSQMSIRQLRTVTWKVNLALDGVATCRFNCGSGAKALGISIAPGPVRFVSATGWLATTALVINREGGR